MAVTVQDIQTLYIAYFNRPGDYFGTQFQLEAARASSLDAVAEAFARSPEFQQTYAGQTDAQFINSLYMNLFGRASDAAGRAFWLDLLNKGIVTHGSIAMELVKGATNEDKVTIANKVAAAAAFYAEIDTAAEATSYSGELSFLAAREWLAGITAVGSNAAATAPAALVSAQVGSLLDSWGTAPADLDANAVSTSGGIMSIDMAKAPGINNLSLTGLAPSGAVINNAGAQFKLTFRSATSAPISVKLANDSGSADTVSIGFASLDGSAATGMITAANVETVRIVTTSKVSYIPDNTAMAVPVTAESASSVIVSGTLGVDLSGGMRQGALTLLDASGLFGHSGLRFTAGALREEALIKGSANGVNAIDFSAAGKAVSYVGGKGSDNIAFASANGQANLVTLGNGANFFDGGSNATGNNVIAGGSDVDTILVGNGNNTIDAGAGDDLITVGSGANSLTLGSGNDTVLLSTVNQSSATYTVVKDISAGDQIDTGIAFTNATGKLGAAIPTGLNDFAALLNAAAGKGSGVLSWFQWGGDTFMVQDVAAAPTYSAGQDLIIKLTGQIDLSNATLSAGAEVLSIIL